MTKLQQYWLLELGEWIGGKCRRKSRRRPVNSRHHAEYGHLQPEMALSKLLKNDGNASGHTNVRIRTWAL
jgi:hypothetical protein